MLASVLVGSLAALWLYLLPGAGLLARLLPASVKLDWAARAGLAGSLSLAIYPVLFLWAGALGIDLGAWTGWALGATGGVLLALPARRSADRHETSRTVARLGPRWAIDGILALLLLLVVVSRLLPIRDMLAPAWGDSVQHSFIVQLLLDHGGLFESWMPYAPMQSFTYHFGFHASAAAWSWLTGVAAEQAVLVVGQIVNVLAVLALYPLVVRLADGNRWAGVAAVLIAGLLTPMPAFYVNWGRYTQLAGQTILPAILWSLDVWWIEKERPSWRQVALLALLLAGTALAHYRIVLLAGLAVLSWSLWGIWAWRRTLSEWRGRALRLGTALGIALLVIAPWLARLDSGILVGVYDLMARLDPRTFSPSDITREWSSVGAYLSPLLILAALGAALLGLAVGQRLIVLLLLWCSLSFLAANPFLLGLPGTGFVTDFALIIALYIPSAIALGWLIGRVCARLARGTIGTCAVLAALVVAAAFGFRARLGVIDPAYQLVTAADLRAFEWIAEHTAPDARFLINGFSAYQGQTTVGSDAGWWIPLYTRRSATIPPLPYTVEEMPSEKARYDVRILPTYLRRAQGFPWLLRRVLCWTGASHIYLGDKQGTVGTAEPPLLPAEWLRVSPDLELVFSADRAQVWAFDRERCPPGSGAWP